MDKIFIEGVAHGGMGIGKIKGKVTFVHNALPNEIVYVEIIEDKKDFSIAKAINFEKTSKHRVEPKCEYYEKCGGCDFQHIAYDYQLKLKADILRSIFKRISKIDINDIKVVESKDIFHYRRRVKFQCAGKRWGLFQKKSKNPVVIEHCKIADKAINEFISGNDCIKKEIVLSDDNVVNKKESVLNLSDVVDNLYLIYEYGSFVQVNRDINLKMVKTVVDSIRQKNVNRVFDFFGGIGNFSIPLAAYGINVVSFDSNKGAVKSFNRNAKGLKLTNIAKSIRKNLIKPFDIDIKPPDCVILDPPRAGAKKVVEYIDRNKPEYVLYVSCEPSTLARDLITLKDSYIIEKVTLFDMFPQTHHFETLVELKFDQNKNGSLY